MCCIAKHFDLYINVAPAVSVVNCPSCRLGINLSCWIVVAGYNWKRYLTPSSRSERRWVFCWDWMSTDGIEMSPAGSVASISIVYPDTVTWGDVTRGQVNLAVVVLSSTVTSAVQRRARSTECTIYQTLYIPSIRHTFINIIHWRGHWPWLQSECMLMKVMTHFWTSYKLG